ncbi:MAG: serine--tRNA ligase [Candidatus Pacebacteria bacterium]|jgi:seryl-tRNA synthetase|nr:serine--tRNA ligase [Candidatus Paceibacterota bacterium]MBT4651872.1 serine--tRNA ligase [Candidatus Paceibacterota bacterium]MBT6755692.1 serine--tRNA ligase [Candidatus Paceibacterota bacterium]MBT6921198.1 serine--tRNA ligase [Candidatus Paceibacterota bacterium]
MLDINYIRENPDQVKKACEDKQLDSSVVDSLLAIDEKRRSLIAQVQELREAANKNVTEVKKQVASDGKPAQESITIGKQLKAQLKELEPELKLVEKEFLNDSLQIPNVPAADVPVGSDESENEVTRHEGDLPKFDFDPKPHQELMENLDMLDTKRGVKIAGFRGYFLKGDGLLLERALLDYALDVMIKYDFVPMSAPVLLNKEAFVGTGYFPWGQEDHYKTQDETILAGTSEVALTAFHMGETLIEKDLPIKMAGISPCFRREIGTYGKDTQGIVRVHQFNKVEQVIYTVADEEVTREWHQKMLGYSEEVLKGLGLPYQVLLMCTGDMGAGQRKKYDIETWFPFQEKYRETHSASYFNDFQARRLNIRYQAKDGTLKHVYTLNNTVAASPRLLAAMIENYQQADGSILVPEVLQPYIKKEVIR